MAAEEEAKLTRAEKFLEDDDILFEEFLKENDKNSGEAIKMYQLYKLHLENIINNKSLVITLVLLL